MATVGGARHVLLWILTGHRANMSVVPCLALRALMCWGWLQLVSCQSVFSGLDQNQVEHPLAQTPLGLFALLRDWICLRVILFPAWLTHVLWPWQCPQQSYPVIIFHFPQFPPKTRGLVDTSHQDASWQLSSDTHLLPRLPNSQFYSNRYRVTKRIQVLCFQPSL